MKISFYVNADLPVSEDRRKTLAASAGALGIDVVSGGAADVVVALGGDGTILRAVHAFPGVPVLGLNFGGLGYLSSVEGKDARHALELLARGQYRLSPRSMLGVSHDGAACAGGDALNDVVIVREHSGHAARLDLAVDGRPVTRYMADGLVFATPTGSTAYSLAAGGPVLMPDSESFVVTPMNPHALGVRPMVVRESAHFRVTPRRRADDADGRLAVYADGVNLLTLEPGESVEICKSAREARLVTFDGYDPYEVLARKLGWNGSNVK